ncbi:MAG: serine/threonine-protein kinase [Kofleriaceae bacterium]|nr:serine/threonine-protein kinase [Kofleriaceae bacterium]
MKGGRASPSAATLPLRKADPARVREVFDAAADLPPDDRAAFVRDACGDDAALAAEVMALLGYAEPPSIRTAPASPPMPATVGRFAITGKLGQGGMGVVYRGRDPTLARDVAIKLVTGAGKDAHARLVREAHAMARVAHPHVVPVYEVGTEGEQIFVAMELVEGTTLSVWLRAEPRPWRTVVRHLVDAGRGLAAAHRAGILHRDFKPENILIGDDGRARVIDFGLARDAGTGGADGALFGDGLTRQGAVAGTPGYMSPEHFAGALTPLSDQWSFAATAYVALFGHMPFAGDTIADLRAAVTEGTPRLPALGSVPPLVADAVLRGLQPDPEDRFPSLDELLGQLEAVLADPQTDAAASRRQRQKLAIGVALLGVINFLAGGLRTDFAFDWGVRGVLIQGVVGIPLLAIGAVTMRTALWRTPHDRRVMGLMFTVLAALALHRAVMLDEAVVVVMRGDAVVATALLVLGALTVERWFAASAALMVGFVALSYAVPSVAVPAFGLTLIGTLSLGIWFWREPPLPPHVSARRTGASGSGERRRSRTGPPRS